MGDWTDRIVGDRMAVDREFNERIAASEFSSQEWGMIMTAVEFEIETPEQPDEATLVANTEKLEQVMPALENVGADAAAMGGLPGGGRDERASGGGLFDTIKETLGLGSDGADEERIAAAEALTDEYAERLQTRLEEHGKWTTACEAAAGSTEEPATVHDDASETETTGSRASDESTTGDEDTAERS